MKKIYLALLPFILIVNACNQQKPELVTTPAAAAPDTMATDTALQEVAAETPALPACSLEAPLLLPDTTATDAKLQAYLQDLTKAVQAQDAQQLQKLTAPDIRTGFGEEGGWESFAKQWQPGKADSEVWLLLDHLLRLGGGYPLASNKDLYALPYVYSNWPDSVDAFMHIAVTKTGAILREEPAANAPARCTLNHYILKVDYEKSYPEGAPQKEWWHVQSPDGALQGYLHHADVHSPVGYRAIFNRSKNGAWQMTALVNGD
ncbi:hypothetical protein [Pontibacter mangrovi]|uniref:SH3 domain-containing protein n=1 Tax=Pontibacter mangrovi TaxID=2589816 RepID=A0A501W339_9BACT|nr:hypothetical protein [Pontibacter mangrovi]TPE43698.1 hypothetical protein FJM65_13200 [Pontibacter mangrovi]